MPWPQLVAVAVGGATGASLRALANAAFADRLTVPITATVLVNIAGSLLIGIAVPVLATASPAWRLLIVTGLLGSLTTFSTFSYETVELLQHRQYIAAAVNAIGSLVVGLLAVAAGLTIGGRLAPTG